MQNDFSHIKEFLDSMPLHNTTREINISEAVNQSFQKFDIDFSECSAIVTIIVMVQRQ